MSLLQAYRIKPESPAQNPLLTERDLRLAVNLVVEHAGRCTRDSAPVGDNSYLGILSDGIMRYLIAWSDRKVGAANAVIALRAAADYIEQRVEVTEE